MVVVVAGSDTPDDAFRGVFKTTLSTEKAFRLTVGIEVEERSFQLVASKKTAADPGIAVPVKVSLKDEEDGKGMEFDTRSEKDID